MSHDASSYSMDELVDIVLQMKVYKKKLRSDITALKNTRKMQTEKVFEKIFAINPKQANLDFIDFEDASKSFSDRIYSSRISMLQEVNKREENIGLRSETDGDDYEKLLLELHDRESVLESLLETRRFNPLEEGSVQSSSSSGPVEDPIAAVGSSSVSSRTAYSSAAWLTPASQSHAFVSSGWVDSMNERPFEQKSEALLNKYTEAMAQQRRQRDSLFRLQLNRTSDMLDRLGFETKSSMRTAHQTDLALQQKLLQEREGRFRREMQDIHDKITMEYGNSRSRTIDTHNGGMGWKSDIEEEFKRLFTNTRGTHDHERYINEDFIKTMDIRRAASLPTSQLATSASASSLLTNTSSTATTSSQTSSLSVAPSPSELLQHPMNSNEKPPIRPAAHSVEGGELVLSSAISHEVGELNTEYLGGLIHELSYLYMQIGANRLRPSVDQDRAPRNHTFHLSAASLDMIDDNR